MYRHDDPMKRYAPAARTLRDAFPSRHDTGLSGPYVRPGVMAALLRAVRRLLESKGSL